MTFGKALQAWTASTFAHLVVLTLVLWHLQYDQWDTSRLRLLVVLVIGSTLCCSLYSTYVRYLAATGDQLQKLGKLLWSPTRFRQQWGCIVLSILVGNRFGRTGDAAAVELWRAWWLRHGANLTWDDRVEAFVELELIGQEHRPVTGRAV